MISHISDWQRHDKCDTSKNMRKWEPERLLGGKEHWYDPFRGNSAKSNKVQDGYNPEPAILLLLVTCPRAVLPGAHKEGGT